MSIQTAIDMAGPQDDVLVHPGTYFEAIDFRGKGIVVHSLTGPAATIIDGRHSFRSVVSFVSGEPSSAALVGFTVTGGRYGTPENDVGVTRFGVGVFIRDSSPQILSNYIVANQATEPWTFGGGIAVFSSVSQGAPLVAGNVIADNFASGNGGGLHAIGAVSLNVLENVFERNHAGFDGGGLYTQVRGCVSTNLFRDNLANDHGGGLTAFGSISNLDDLDIRLNVFLGNTARGLSSSGLVGAGGGMHLGGSNVSAANNTVIRNTGEGARPGGGVLFEAPSNLNFSSNIVALNVGGGVVCSDAPAGSIQSSNNLLWDNEEFSVHSTCLSAFPSSGYAVSDPLFCGLGPELSSHSPALIGPVVIGAISEPGCDIVTVTPTSWGDLKLRFSRVKE